MKRRAMISAFCKNMKFTTMSSLRKILEIFVDTKVESKLSYNQFIKFIRVDDCMESRDVFYSCAHGGS